MAVRGWLWWRWTWWQSRWWWSWSTAARLKQEEAVNWWSHLVADGKNEDGHDNYPFLLFHPSVNCDNEQISMVVHWQHNNCLSRWTFYSFIHVTGILLMWDKAWVWDITQCWSTSKHGYKIVIINIINTKSPENFIIIINNSCVDVTLGQVGLPKPPHWQPYLVTPPYNTTWILQW